VASGLSARFYKMLAVCVHSTGLETALPYICNCLICDPAVALRVGDTVFAKRNVLFTHASSKTWINLCRRRFA
jgi:hypothetical protein